MTAVIGATTIPATALGRPRLLAGLDRVAVLDLAMHRQRHGEAPAVSGPELIRWCEQVDLRGRGGAGFPFARKLKSLARTGRPVVVVNGEEGEPASWKDRAMLRRAPHLVLDGAQAVAEAIGARWVHVAIRDQLGAQAVANAIAERRGRIKFDIVSAPGGFVASEAQALVRALSGGPAKPPGRRVLPTERGVDGAPTLLSNVETFAQIAQLVRLGPVGYAAGATTLLTVGGAVSEPGVVEVPLGTQLAEVLDLTGSATPAALVVGGYHGAWVRPNRNLALSPAGLQAAGGTLGAGVVLVVDQGTCPLGELTRVAGWLAAQSVRQCGPCTFGLPAIVDDLHAAVRGTPRGAGAAERHARMVTGRGACAHPDGAARFVTSGLRLLRDDVDRHLRHRGCGRPVLGRLPVGA